MIQSYGLTDCYRECFLEIYDEVDRLLCSECMSAEDNKIARGIKTHVSRILDTWDKYNDERSSESEVSQFTRDKLRNDLENFLAYLDTM